MSDTPPTPPSSGGLPPALANLSPSTLGWAQTGGAAAVLISTFLPWFSFSFGVTITANLFDISAGRGVIVLLLSLIVGALGFVAARGMEIPNLKLPPFTNVIAAGLLLLLVFIFWIDVLDSSGFGAWLALIGALVAFGAALLPVLKARQS